MLLKMFFYGLEIQMDLGLDLDKNQTESKGFRFM